LLENERYFGFAREASTFQMCNPCAIVAPGRQISRKCR